MERASVRLFEYKQRTAITTIHEQKMGPKLSREMKLTKAIVRHNPYTAFPDGGQVKFILRKRKQRLTFQNNNYRPQ